MKNIIIVASLAGLAYYLFTEWQKNNENETPVKVHPRNYDTQAKAASASVIGGMPASGLSGFNYSGKY